MSRSDERDAQIAERDEQIASLQETVADLSTTLSEIYSSRGWRLLAPLRWYSQQSARAIRVVKALPSLVYRSGGVFPFLSLFMRIWREGGWQGIRTRARQYLAAYETLSQPPLNSSSSVKLLSQNKLQRPEILFISHEATRTGAPVFLLRLMKHISYQLDMDFVILLRSGGELVPDFSALGKTIVLSDPFKLDPLVLNRLKRRNIKLIYSSTITNGMLQAQLKELKCPLLCHVHELSYSIENFFGGKNIKQILDTTNMFLAGSKAVARNLHEQLKIPEERIILAYPFISVQENLDAIESVELPLDLPKDAIVIGTCGTISWRKGPDILLQVARLVLQKTNKPVFFIWVGGPLSHGDYFKLRYDARLMGIEQAMIFTGNVQSHLPYFSQFDIFLLPSREDPFPLVVMDAASLGIPIICFDRAGGAPELAETDAGIVVPYLDVESMADAILQLSNNDSLRKQLGRRAQQKVVERHDVSVGGEYIVDLFKKLQKKV